MSSRARRHQGRRYQSATPRNLAELARIRDGIRTKSDTFPDRRKVESKQACRGRHNDA